MTQIGYPNWPTLTFAIPFTGKPIPYEIMLAFRDVSPPMNYNMVTLVTKGAPIADARNHFAEQAVAMNSKYLFFMDEDVKIPAQTLRELIFQMEHHDDWGVIGGIYCLKSDRPEPLVFRGAGTGPFWDWRVGEIFEVTGIGMGCTLLRVEMLKELEKPWFRTVSDLSPYLDNVPAGEVWTEDLWFCHKVLAGKRWKIYAHGQILCPHYNMATGQPFELPPDSKPARHLLAPTGKKKIVDLGCGENKLKTNEGSVIGIDIRDLPGVDYRCDLRKLPLATGSMDIVFSSHTLEHFPRNQVDSVVDEWVRVMKSDGEFRIILPDISWAAEQIKKDNVDGNVLNVLYGSQEYTENFHKVGFTESIVLKILRARGFKHFDVKHEGYNMLVRAWKSSKSYKVAKGGKGGESAKAK